MFIVTPHVPFSFLIRDAICFCNIEQSVVPFLPWVSINSCNYNNNRSIHLFCCRLPKNTGLRPVGSAKRDLIQLQYNYNTNDPCFILLHRMSLFSFLIRDAICFCNIEQHIHLFLPWVSINSCNYNNNRSIHLFCCRLPKNTGLRPVRSAKRDFSEDWFRKR